MKLYEFQKQGVNEIFKIFKTENSACLSWYTGAGKTNTFIEIAKRFIKENPAAKVGISSYFTTEVRDQIFERTKSFGFSDTQVFKYENKIDLEKNIYVFNPQGLYFKDIDLKFDLFIIDECHVGLVEGTKMIRHIMKKNCHKNTKILLVSATPWDALTTKMFKETKVLKRPMDLGLKDNLIDDVKFYAEEANIEFDLKDFTRKGDLAKTMSEKKTRLLKSACHGKLKNIISRYDKKLGKKILVICPSGNVGETARYLAKDFGGLACVFSGAGGGRIAHLNIEKDLAENIEIFKKDKSRFLFVVFKGTIGFDMKNLDTVIDLTMTRNITLLAQRLGRVARKNGDTIKKYFYVYDKSLLKDRLQWLLMTMVDFGLGHYDGWDTKTVKHRKQTIFHGFSMNDGVYLSEVIKLLKNKNSITNKKIMAFVDYRQPTSWTLDLAKERAKKYLDRTDMWKREPGLYKWFRINAKAEMDKIFPIKYRNGKWNKEKLIAAMKTCKSRDEFKQTYRGAVWHMVNKLDKNEIERIKNEIWGETRINGKPYWNEKTITSLFKTFKTFKELRVHGGARHWVRNNGGSQKWRQVFNDLKGIK